MPSVPAEPSSLEPSSLEPSSVEPSSVEPSRTMAHRPQDVQATYCATLVDEWVRAGLTHAVISPGSRSTPMALALAAEPKLRVAVVLDERSAAFRALGTARVTGRATVLLCTSGTAAVEYHPAVAEADLDRVPLIVCTADRPSELHGIGAPQTVDQQALFGRSVRWFGQLGVPDEANQWTWRSFAARAVCEAMGSVRGPGPVHLNLPFREPLLGVAGSMPLGRPDGRPWHSVVTGRNAALAPDRLEPLRTVMHGRRGILLAGAGTVNPGDGYGAEVIHRLGAALGWPVVADPRSGLRTEASTTVSAADPILRSEGAAHILRPEVVLRLGAPWASKVMGQWLAGLGDAVHVLVDPFGAWLDPQRQAEMVMCADPIDVALGLIELGLPAAPPTWMARWRLAALAAERVLSNQLDAPLDAPVDAPVELSEPLIARTLLRRLPSSARLVVSSSMPIRDVEWFGPSVQQVEVVANRGANGIDGVVSTVLGAASSGDGRPTAGLLGDLAFLHDAGALAGAGDVGATFFVVDNGGGGIFEFLPQAAALPRTQFEALFGTPQTVSVAAVSRAYGATVVEPTTVQELLEAIDLVVEPGLRVVVMKTNRASNVIIHNKLNAAIIAAVEAQVVG